MTASRLQVEVGRKARTTWGANMIDGFKKFLLRGNVVDLAVAVVIGAAFGAVVKGLLDGIITPLIAAIFGKPDISGVLSFTIHNAHFSIGTFLNAILNFIVIAAVIYFLVVVPMMKIQERRARGVEPEPEAIPEDTLLLRQIRDALGARPQDGTAGPTPQHPLA
jgi:large conductance mechanosensitive channel